MRGLGAAAAATTPLARLEAQIGTATETLLADPVEALGQAWINSPAGALIDPVINTPFELLTGRDLIGNSAAGAVGINGGEGTDGGWLFGNGGPGAPQTATTPAGRGGDAGWFGNGGPGGAALPGSGGNGGAGGNGGIFFGDGGPGAPGAASLSRSSREATAALAATPSATGTAVPVGPVAPARKA